MAKHLWQIPDDLTPEQLEAEALEFDKQAAMMFDPTHAACVRTSAAAYRDEALKRRASAMLCKGK